MAEILDPIVVSFSNNRTRSLADLAVEDYESQRAYIAEHTAKGIAVKVSGAANGDTLADGSPADGRTQMTVGIFNALLTAAQAKVTWYETVVSGKTRIEWYRSVNVNGRSRF
jgi:hypothetical protein